MVRLAAILIALLFPFGAALGNDRAGDCAAIASERAELLAEAERLVTLLKARRAGEPGPRVEGQDLRLDLPEHALTTPEGEQLFAIDRRLDALEAEALQAGCK